MAIPDNFQKLDIFSGELLDQNLPEIQYFADLQGGIVVIFEMDQKYFIGWLPYMEPPKSENEFQKNSLGRKLQYWWIKDFSRNSKILKSHFLISSLVNYVGQIDTVKPNESILLIPGSSIDLFSSRIQNNFSIESLPQDSHALISAYSGKHSDDKLSHLYTARFDQYKIFTQAKFNKSDGLIYCNALSRIVVMKFNESTGFNLVKQFSVGRESSQKDLDLMKGFYLFDSGIESNNEVFAYVDQENKLKLKYK